MPLAVCQQEVNLMKHKKVELVETEKPLLLVFDPSPVFLRILEVILRRAECDVEIASFQELRMAKFWLSGQMDKQKAAWLPFESPWDAYPALRPPTVAIVNLGFPTQIREDVLDWLRRLSGKTSIITTSTKETLLDQEEHWDEAYWHQVVAHLPQPVKVDDVVERVIAVLSH